MLTKSSEKVAPIFECLICDYFTSRKSSYDKHLTTSKHNLLTNVNTNATKSCKNEFNCLKCNKKYKSRVGLWKHKNKCYPDEPSDKQLMMMVIKDNSELKNMVMEVIKNGTHNTINNTNTNNNNNTNSHNKAFNLNFFLNETCKDAMNIMDFVDSIKLQLTDLEKVGELGFVDGISNIIVKKFNDLDITKRPVHCTDKKREVLYVKDQDKWQKENEEKIKLRKAIKAIASKNIKMLSTFKEKYPDCYKSESMFADKYNKLVIESFGGSGNEDYDNENKIIKKMAKIIMVQKEGELSAE